MKTLTTILTLLLLAQLSIAQSISNEVIAPAGESYVTNTHQVDFTMGETVVATYSNSSNTITQGFHQTNLVVTAISEIENEIAVQLYPNPVSETLTLSFSEQTKGVVLYKLLDMNGKLLQEKENVKNNEQIDFSNYAKGTYFVKIVNTEQQELKIYKVQKQ